ncbi:TRAP-type C4-dicarboxylate transport system permease small subunit [Bosea sp. OAE506]|uniref:TRAP transporter small permease subunit n=1 Tax=Bosea sp. OAE506 TaxID=2663870 RepID=UPI0019E3E78D
MADATETNLDARPDAPRGAFDAALSVMAAIGTVWIFLTMFMIVADVLGRNVFNAPITGVAEIAGRSVVGIVFLQIAAAVAGGRMTRADFLINMIEARSPRAADGLEAVFALAGAVVFGLIAAASWHDLSSSWRSNDFFGVQGLFTIPTWPFWAITVIGAAAAGLAYLVAMTARLSSRPPAGA